MVRAEIDALRCCGTQKRDGKLRLGGWKGVREDFLEEETVDLSFKAWAGVLRHTAGRGAFCF